MRRELSPRSQPGRRRDDRFDALKRRVIAVARLDGEPLALREGLFLARIERVTNPRALVAHLSVHGVLDRRTLEAGIRLTAPLVALDPRTLSAAHHDLRVLEARPARDALGDHRRAFGRIGRVDDAWLEQKRRQLDAFRARLDAHAAHGPRPKAAWFDGVVELVHATRGARDARLLGEAGARVAARAAERRREASARVHVVAGALIDDGRPGDEELARSVARLDAAFDLPGRARRRRALDVLRQIVAWPSAAAALVETLVPERVLQGLSAQALDREAYAAFVDQAGQAMAAALPVVRDPKVRERSLTVIALLGLAFPIDDDGVPLPDESAGDDALSQLSHVLELAPSGVSLAQAVALSKLKMGVRDRTKIAKWIAEGLELDLVATYAETMSVEPLARVPDVRAARAYAIWATRLAGHYKAMGVEFSLSPELFASLPRNEDLAVLAMCLMEQVDPRTGANAPSDPLAVLDATLALFQRLPAKARGILGSLRGSHAGEGRRRFPEFAAWLDDDALLDRYVHVAGIAGQTTNGPSPLLSSAIREDFEHVTRTRGERAHLEQLAARSVPQQGRLDALLREERTLAGSPKGRTRRRIAERLDELLPLAYQRELDTTFREILLEAWNIKVPSLTPAWRDAVRLWLVVDDNRELLGDLLRHAANAPGRDVKDAFPKNEPWLAKARGKLAVDAWAAPRTRRFEVDGTRYVLELEGDPLEVLRMGIPFGTCLSTDGVNAASTILNAIDANKRVLYVRNEAGRVVARKLLAISKDLELLGYNLYVSVTGKAQLAIRAAVLDACRSLARDVGTPFSTHGEPAKIHEGFWYDDGTVAFESEVDVAAYCAQLELPVPPKHHDALAEEAAAWCAQERGDVDAALASLMVDRGPANGELGAWIVERLGARAAEKKAADDISLFPPLARSLVAGAGEDGVVRVLELAGRLPAAIGRGMVGTLLAHFPPSAKLACGLVDLGSRIVKRSAHADDRSLASLTMLELPPMLDDVAGAFDLLDTVAPAWERAGATDPESLYGQALERSANAVEAIFARAPDPDVVRATLMSRRRSVPSHRAALRVAAQHVLPNGDRALTRFAALRPELAGSGDGIAALVRQARVDRVTELLVKQVDRLPRPRAPVFEALRDLVLSCEGLERLFPFGGRVTDIDAWAPRAWELAWRRRRNPPDDELAEALFERAARAPRTVTLAMEGLALLGDLERIGSLDHVPPSGRGGPSGRAKATKAKAKTPTRKPEHPEPIACRRTAASLAEQVRAERRGRLDPNLVALSRVDAGYADLARRVLLEGGRETDLAREVVLAVDAGDQGSGVIDWQRLLAAAADAGDLASATRILDSRTGARLLPPRLVVDLWQLPEARSALAGSIARLRRDDWTARVWAAEREAAARGIDVEGLLEAVALALMDIGAHDEAMEIETVDQLGSIAKAIAAKAAPADVVSALQQAEDALSMSTLIRAIRRQPVDRAAAIRDAGAKANLTSDRGRAIASWLESTRQGQGRRSRSGPKAEAKASKASAREKTDVRA